MQIIEAALASGLPESFRPGGDPLYLPHRYLEENARMIRFNRLADRTGVNDMARQRLKDLVFNNCAGRNFSLPDNAGDFLGAVDSEKNPDLANCIVLVKVKDPSSNEDAQKFILAIPGGFNEFGETIERTIAREGFEETNAKNASNFVLLGEQSNLIRDNHYHVISESAACVLNYDELKAKDDAREIIVVPLINKDGSFNHSYFKAGSYVDATGKEFAHDGLRADHGEVINQTYLWWKVNGEPKGWTFDETLKQLSIGERQEAFKNFHANPPEEVYERRLFKAGEILLTPNVKFALEKSTEILKAAGAPDAEETAAKFIIELLDEENDLLPRFPQRATTVHCLVVEGDDLVVFQRKDGSLGLPGKYYSPEKPNSSYQQKYTFARNLRDFAVEVAEKEFGIDFRPKTFIGAAALGDQLDEPYPTLSYVYAGVSTASHRAKVLDIPQASKIVKIPIWEDKKKGILSKEILEGIDGQGWAFNHGIRVIQLYLKPFLVTKDPDGRQSAEDILRSVII